MNLSHATIQAILSSFLILSLGSCRLNQSSSSESSWFSGLDIFSSDKSAADSAGSYFPVQFVTAKTTQATTLVSLLKSSCVSKAENSLLPDTIWLLQIESAFGNSEVKITTKNPPVDGAVRIDVDDRSYIIRPPTGIDERIAADACISMDQNQTSHLATNNDSVAYFSSILKLLAPDCDFRPLVDGEWHCNIDAVEASLAEREIRELQSTIVRRWSRLPYILTRRLAVSQSLANAVSHSAKMPSFCKILDFSIPEELPLVFSSLRWRQAVCGNSSDEQRSEAATIGLSKALNEIELLRQLFEQSSNLGMMTLRLPKELETPTREFWISLAPHQDVAENLAKLSARIWAENVASSNKGQEITTGCWHPIFGSEHAKLLLAKQLDLVGTAGANLCTDITAMPPEVSDDPHRYLAGSITSETEFVLNNHGSILLRLPIGSYDVQLRHHIPANDDWETDPPLLGTSSMSWTKQRPKIVVNTLENTPTPQ
jgi:hypothetical protein